MKKPLQLLAVLLLSHALCGPAAAQRGYNRTQYAMLDEARTLMESGQWSDAYRIY